MKKICLLLCLSFCCFGQSQTKKSLKEMLWERVSLCYNELEYNGDKNPNWKDSTDITIIDDAKNGYLKVAGTYPTCGCYCETTVGAYRQANGNYTLLETEHFGCSFTKSIKSNKALQNVLPEDFGLLNFVPSLNKEDILARRLFYLDLTIPQKGTKTIVRLQYVPYGVSALAYENGLVYAYSGATNYNNHYGLKYAISQFEDKKTLSHLRTNEIDKINETDKSLLLKIIGKHKDYATFDAVCETVTELYNLYKQSQKIEFSSIHLGWDKEKGRFYIQNKIKSEKVTPSFYEFISNLPFWMAIC